MKKLGKKCVLIAHNGQRFDHALLVRSIEHENFVAKFQKRIHGFADSIPLFKQAFPDRAGEGGLKLGNLAKDLLQINGYFHEAMFDMKILESLCSKFIKSSEIKKKLVTFNTFVAKKNEQKLVRSKMPDVYAIKKITNVAVCKKIIAIGMS